MSPTCSSSTPLDDADPTPSFDVVVDNPEGFFENPSAIVADPDLTDAEKLRLVEEWALDLELKLNADSEGMTLGADAAPTQEGETLRQAQACLRVLRGETPAEPRRSAPTGVAGRIWRKLSLL